MRKKEFLRLSGRFVCGLESSATPKTAMNIVSAKLARAVT